MQTMPRRRGWYRTPRDHPNGMDLLRWAAFYVDGGSFRVYRSGPLESLMTWESLPNTGFLALRVVYQQTYQSSAGPRRFSDVFYGQDYIIRTGPSAWENRTQRPTGVPRSTWKEGFLLPDAQWEIVRLACHAVSEITG